MKKILGLTIVLAISGVATLRAEQPPNGAPPPNVQMSAHEHYATLDKDLDMTADQKQKWQAIQGRTVKTLRAIEEDKALSAEKKVEDTRRMHEVLDKELRAILTPPQIRKWDQIRMGITNRPPIRREPMVQGQQPKIGEAYGSVKMSAHEHYETLDKDLDMTAAQKEKWKGIMARTTETIKAVEKDTKLTPEKKVDDLKRLHEVTDKEIRAILTPEQNKKWDRLREAQVKPVPVKREEVARPAEK